MIHAQGRDEQPAVQRRQDHQGRLGEPAELRPVPEWRRRLHGRQRHEDDRGRRGGGYYHLWDDRAGEIIDGLGLSHRDVPALSQAMDGWRFHPGHLQRMRCQGPQRTAVFCDRRLRRMPGMQVGARRQVKSRSRSIRWPSIKTGKRGNMSKTRELISSTAAPRRLRLEWIEAGSLAENPGNCAVIRSSRRPR